MARTEAKQKRTWAGWTLAAALAVTLTTALAGCGGGRSAGDGLQGLIEIDGSSTVFPITEAVAEEFQREHPNVHVTVGVSGTGGGFKKLGNGETVISNASRPIKQSEVKLAGEHKIEFIELPIAYDAISVVVNPGNEWMQNITVEELKKIWEPAAQGKITRWSQVRPGWPDAPIKLYGPGADSGTFDYFTDAIVGEEGASRGDYTASEDDNVLVQGISRDPNALGYFGVAYYLENQDKLKAVPVDDGNPANGSGPQMPTVENVQTGTYQPLARPVFIYVSKAATERPEVQAFIEFYLDHAAELAEEVGYVPLQPDVYDLVKQRFQNRVTGSLFAGGGSQVGVNLAEVLRK